MITHFCARGISQCLKHNVISVRQYHKIDTDMLDKVLLDESWSGIFDMADMNVCAEAFTLVVQYVMNALVPLRTLRIKQQRIPWGYDPTIAATRRQRDSLHRKALKSGDSDIWAAYRRCRNRVTALVQSSKRRYLQHLASVDNNTKFWRHFKYLSSHRKAHQHSDVSFSCEDINCHFLSIATKTVSDLPSVDTSPLEYVNTCNDVPSMSILEVNTQDVVNYISQLDTNKAVGIDGISTNLLELLLIVWLCFLQNSSTRVFCHQAFLIAGKLQLLPQV